MISQVFVLSSRGDVLLFKDYKNELSHATHEMFYKAISSETPPSAFFNIDGINFVSVKVGGIYFVCTLLDIHTLPSTISSFTAHFTRVVKDYCGTITESSLRNNFVLLYEILDEVIDFGFIQHCTTAKLKHLISNEAIGEGESGGLLDEVLKVKTKGSSAAAKPIAISVEEDRNQKNEVYLDLVEKLVVTIDSEGQVTRADIIGKLVLKSYLKGNPEVQIGLAHNLKVRTRDEINNSDCIVDDINFHPCVNQDSFDNDRSIHFYPSDGETVVLTYRKHESFTPPFKCYVQVEEVGSKMIDVIVKLNPTFPSSSSAVDVALTFKAPRGVDGVSFSMSYDYEDEEAEQSAVFIRQKKQILWKLGKVQGGREQILRAKFNWDEEPKSQNILKEIGSILIDFEVPMYLCSNLKIRYLRIMERSAQYEPERWVRYMSQSESYRFRL